MSQCELCGRSSEFLKTVKIEGVEMNCCAMCAKSGVEVKDYVFSAPQKRGYQKKEESYDFIIPNAGELIKQKREQMKLKQSELANKLQIKESIVHQVESGHLKPTENMAQKFEKGLGISIRASHKLGSTVNLEKTETKSFTMADFIKKKK